MSAALSSLNRPLHHVHCHSRRPRHPQTQIGFVTSRSGDKSVKVTIAYKTPHPLYHKVVNRQTVLHVHDEKNETKVGDKVEVMETRPLSRLKRWRVVSIVQKAVTTDAVAISEADVAATVPTKTTQSPPSRRPLRSA